MWPCPSVPANISTADFWRLMADDPVPRIIPGSESVDFVREFGHPTADGGARFEFAEITPAGERYRLANPGRYQSQFFAALPRRFPLPEPLRAIDLTPMVSVGLHGPGQIDLARHYHGVTAMRLLQGSKIWALRPPNDPECMSNSGTCTDPFDVCKHYAAKAHQPPACVQGAGDTILIPDGWHHGTCNAADGWTVGWGGQNRRLKLDPPPSCRHCRPAGPFRFLTASTETTFLLRHHAALFVRQAEAEAEVEAEGSCHPRGRGGRAAEPVSATALRHGSVAPLIFRGLFLQLLGLDMGEAATMRSFMDPECYALRYCGGAAGHDTRHGGAEKEQQQQQQQERRQRQRQQQQQQQEEHHWASWLRSGAHAYAYAPAGSVAALLSPVDESLASEASNASDGGGGDSESGMAETGMAESGLTRLAFVHRASGEVEWRSLPPRTAAAWHGDALVAMQAGPHVILGGGILDGALSTSYKNAEGAGMAGEDHRTEPAPQPRTAAGVGPGGATSRIVQPRDRAEVGVVCRMLSP